MEVQVEYMRKGGLENSNKEYGRSQHQPQILCKKGAANWGRFYMGMAPTAAPSHFPVHGFNRSRHNNTTKSSRAAPLGAHCLW